ncbi:MAG: methyltransferase [Candidatus Omnitrophica bacterium CG12_big_fil_rev_8_21_14_0_65_43_15]|uniref:Methyltransferase n=1 Tax=Candidatus Taenaricola geysiri TaxID=1974752 RepID=A0A2J0LGA5_9BACT|nr:MAG: methyltransferase [Candidatus Omnitrophica bacterium CG1_02_43_210]PIV11852.1 MAG: methyltransferase [Candidatus Omnitrophica bacterium CG03_land_8_20_14_0_80_43_22]PIV39904.1 MAG: methyltransferase [Candidatus Omnitrophica bacterium CG02_land_8_20_14_3_00__42_8]PIW66871.1 MAG: methyltransferase [Candidatus Omnitrophica bacterium CG12_big_fil_rev_8_21_14_0_65_43_15]PIW80295.1 MAG: methyltransferase [Candidatus Omnitrophica bacterium CG_4_8_14_3_um_filter_43_15]
MKKIVKIIYNIMPFKKQLFSLLKIFYKPPESVYRHLHFKGTFKVGLDGKSFKVHHFGYQIENDIFWSGLSGNWEKESIKLWIALSRISNCILDVGANTGMYSLVAKTVNPASKIYAFEPIKRVCQRLKMNCRLNNYDITCEELALSSYDGKAVIYDSNADHVYSVTVNKNMMPAGTDVVESEIQVARLSTYIKQKGISKIDLMKIDVEMHEPEVLKGIEDYLGQMQPTMLMEILNSGVAVNVEQILKGKGYSYFYIDEKNGTLKNMKNITTDGNPCNYLLCNDKIALEVSSHGL